MAPYSTDNCSNSMETELAQAVDVMMVRAKRIEVNKLFSFFSL